MNAAAPAPAPTPQVAIRAKPPSPKRLSRKVLLAGALAMGAAVATALAVGLSERPDRRGEASSQNVATAAGPPETIQMAPTQYVADDLPRGAVGEDIEALPADELAPPADPIWSEPTAARAAPVQTEAPAPDPEALAHVAPILFDARGAVQNAGRVAMSGGGDRRAAFLASQRGGGERLDTSLVPPRSAYELLAGAVIPAALATELNSDLPGRIIAQVTAPVYDSVTGRHLLIPQGARLIGSYDSATAYGDRRLLLVWNRLILPNGWSINLEGMEGADPSGAAGLRDRTDNHLDRLAGAIGLSAIISVVANEADDDDTDNFGRSVGNAAAQEAASSGGRLVDREMTVRPTLRVRAGAPVRVLVTRDIRLRPYRP
ncbi:MAG: TrbI/VirB10 family protein [Hyphomonadaceae bacterium]|nr:TrbI/VirB10 family protein [Hyphomonadaceae bacterium]